MILVSNIASNVQRIRDQIAAAAREAGRRPEEIALVAVSKHRTVAEIRAALAAGITDLGENRVQEAVPKFRELGPGVATWHLIGSLQTNKVRAALEFADLIHSLDRPSLLAELDRQARQQDRTVRTLVQVNVSGEASKHGLLPGQLPGFLEQVAGLGGTVQVEGLMTIAPEAPDPEAARPVFAGLRQLAAAAADRRLPHVAMRWLSMGMSGDYVAAIREGANLVRIGTAIFGPRTAGM